MSSPTYLVRNRHNTYYFRYVIPAQYREILGKREIRRSLGTHRRKDAVKMARYWAVRLELALSCLHSQNMDYTEIKQLLEPTLQGLPDALMSRFMQDGPLTEQRKQELQYQIKAQQGLVKQDLSTPKADELTKQLLAENRVEIESSSEDFNRVSIDLTKIITAAMEHYIGISNEHGSYTLSPTVIAQPPTLQPAVNQSDSGEPLSVVIEKYVEENSQWQPKTKQENQAIYDLFVEIVGDIDIKAFDRTSARHFKEVLQKIPANRNKSKRYEDKGIDTITKMTDVTPMSTTSVNKYLTRVTSLMKWAVNNSYADKNHVEGMLLPKTTQPHEDRDPFGDAELKILFHDLQTNQLNNKRQPERYWIPLITAHTGMRLEEVCQLKATDIKKIDGIWVFDINDEDDKRLKTKSSRRQIPVHPKLIELGFLQYHKSLKDGQLWPRLEKGRDGYGQNFGKWFNRRIRIIGIINPKISFHSLRHTFANQLHQKDVKKERITELLGHSDEDTTARYIKKYDVKGQSEVIKQLKYVIPLL